ncbi:Hypothetical protein, putative [Bodo saltans]|uniref:Secreted protein n=1 Tax=Bodo saltans TaxID=75058 RepID=A0A0S4JEW6_BODSA|nr:Hypothetical protein, putative [Bodo saltans]|eukprot:CUG90113.1 Hypothetical protein, putative [Bodo saltans]
MILLLFSRIFFWCRALELQGETTSTMQRLSFIEQHIEVIHRTFHRENTLPFGLANSGPSVTSQSYQADFMCICIAMFLPSLPTLSIHSRHFSPPKYHLGFFRSLTVQTVLSLQVDF